MADQKIYHAPGLDIQNLGQALSQWFQGQGFETQILAAPGGGVTVQARKADTLRTVTGTSAALSVMLSPQGENLLVQMGSAQWADKAVVSAVGILLFWPALIPATYGFWKQKQLPQQTFQFIDQYLATGGKVPIAPTAFGPAAAPMAQPPKAENRCPSCGQPVREGAKFCDSCGASLARTCAKCGAALRPGAKFCDSCGTQV
jgi:hypothetical protein